MNSPGFSRPRFPATLMSLTLGWMLGLMGGLTGCERQPLQAESRDLGDFSAIDLRGAAEVNIEVGRPATALRIDGTEYAVKNVRTSVSDETLHIDAKRAGWAWFGDGDELRLTISMPKLSSLRSSGAGNIVIKGLQGGEHAIRIAGAHDIEADGELDRLTIEVDGAADVDYGRVKAREAIVTVNGAGHVLVRPTELLKGTVNGVGAIHYEGDPQKVESKINGIGSIERR